MTMEPSGRTDQPGSWERGEQLTRRRKDWGSWEGRRGQKKPYLVQLQWASVPGPGDREQGGVGSGGAADHAPHALGQVGLREHGGHLCWVCGDTWGWGTHHSPHGRDPTARGCRRGGLTEHGDEGRGRRRLPEPVAGGAGVFPSVVRGRSLQQKAPVHQDTDTSLEVAGRGGDSSEWHSWDRPCCTRVMDLSPATHPACPWHSEAQQPRCHPRSCHT